MCDIIRLTNKNLTGKLQEVIKKLYEKSEIWFAVAWIIAYVILASVGDNISTNIGISKIVTLPILTALSVVFIFLCKKKWIDRKIWSL